jgi:hypothetical protein
MIFIEIIECFRGRIGIGQYLVHHIDHGKLSDHGYVKNPIERKAHRSHYRNNHQNYRRGGDPEHNRKFHTLFIIKVKNPERGIT